MNQIHDRLRHRFFSLYDGPVVFHEWCGLRYLAADAEDTRLVMPFSPALCGPDGAISPGMAATLIDVAAGQVAVAAFGWRMQVATVSLQQSILAPIPAGSGLIARARLLSRLGDFVLAAIEIAAEDAPEQPLLRAQGRLIAVRRVEVLDEARPAFPRCDFGADPLAGPESLETRLEDGVLTGHLAFRPQFMGNTSRNALHGGLVAAALYTAAGRFGQSLARPLAVLDGAVDFLASGRPSDMAVSIHAERAGNRAAFICGRLEQEDPQGGGRILVARLTATLGAVAG